MRGSAIQKKTKYLMLFLCFCPLSLSIVNGVEINWSNNSDAKYVIRLFDEVQYFNIIKEDMRGLSKLVQRSVGWNALSDFSKEDYV